MGEGVVEFASRKDMQNAVRKLNDTELFGKHLKFSHIIGFNCLIMSTLSPIKLFINSTSLYAEGISSKVSL